MADSLLSSTQETGARLTLHFRTFMVIACGFIIGGCQPKTTVVTVAPPPPPVEQKPVFSSAPITNASRDQVLLAQTALTKLGYQPGGVDGLWGPRSAKSLQRFESQHSLTSAGGFLSEANLNALSEKSGLTIQSVIAARSKQKTVKKEGIKSKLSGNVKQNKPQLIIVEQPHTIYTQPNPFSEVLLELQAGTGIYVINQNDDWLSVETIARDKGYIQVKP